MTQTLYLTAAELKEWKTLSIDLTKYWTSTEEILKFTDTDEKHAIRVQDAKFSSPVFQDLKEKAASATSAAEANELMEKTSLANISEQDMLEFCFMAGPDVLTGLLSEMLEQATMSHHCEQIAALSTIRHGLLLSQNTFSL